MARNPWTPGRATAARRLQPGSSMAKHKKKRHHGHHHKPHKDPAREEGSDDLADAAQLSDAEFEEAGGEKVLPHDVHTSLNAVDRTEGGVEIHIPWGAVDGVEVGMHGVVEGLDRELKVIRVQAKSCTAFVEAGIDQIKHYKSVILNTRD